MLNRTIKIALALGVTALPLSCGGDDDDSPRGGGATSGKGGSVGNGGASGKGGAGGVSGKGGAGGVSGQGGSSGRTGKGGSSGEGGAGKGGSTSGAGGTAGGTSDGGDGGEPEVTACDANPCRHGGLCTGTFESFVCNCSGTGYTGATCQTSCPDESEGGGGEGGGGGQSGAGAGTPAVTCGRTFTVRPDGFVRAPSAGCPCWHGYASAGSDVGSGESMVTLVSVPNCGPGCVLHATGTVGSATEQNFYAGIVYLGFNLNQAVGSSIKGTVVPTGTGLTVSYVNAGNNAPLRVQISSGSASNTRWCAELATSGATIPYPDFNTECWEGGAGVRYALEPIDTVQIVLPGGATAVPFDLTLLSVKDT